MSVVVFVNVQPNASAESTPANCKQQELTFQQLSQSHNAPAVSVWYRMPQEIKVENDRRSVGSDSSMSETWASTSKQGIADYVATSSVAAANGFVTASPAKKMTNRPSGPRKPKPEVVVSTV